MTKTKPTKKRGKEKTLEEKIVWELMKSWTLRSIRKRIKERFTND